MFCNQCQEAAKNTGCTIKGVCGKTEETSNIQDLLMFACQGLSYLTIEARKQGIDTNAESKHITNCLFMTITNANFDDKSIIQAIKDAIKYRDELKSKVKIARRHICGKNYYLAERCAEIFYKIISVDSGHEKHKFGSIRQTDFTKL